MREHLLTFFIAFLSIAVLNFNCTGQPKAEQKASDRNTVTSDPLPSWNGGDLKQAIINYVRKVTDSNSADFIPLDHRIATFDNDETLLTERPYVQELFAFYQVKEFVGRNLPINKIIYQPQLELLKYLHDNGFKVFVCAGGTVEFVRGISQGYFGIPKEQVIGTSFKYKFVASNLSILLEENLPGLRKDPE